jgi:membrane fusion protein (multidrug efflux system)
MSKKLLFSIVGLVLVIVVLGGIKALQISSMIEAEKSFSLPPTTVTTFNVVARSWENTLSSVGTFVAVRGVTISSELPGRVVDILFTSGQEVNQGDLLVVQNSASEKAQLNEIQAEITLAQLDLKRRLKLLKSNAVSQADYDIAKATYDEVSARAANIQSVIDKKYIRAPFTGRLGIRQIDFGQNIKEDDAIVTLQSLDPIYVNFSLPQHQFHKIKPGMEVRITSNAFEGEAIIGSITTISPLVDETTRNIMVQATVANISEKVIPGMFANVTIILPEQDHLNVIPTTSIIYAPYGDSVFVVEDSDQSSKKIVRQQFVKLEREQGDFVVVKAGLKEGEQVVSTGAFKLQNGQTVVVDNSLSPDFQLHPQPKNE